ncbi:ImmA/IrrE family metallo-endopeptidase [Alteromonas flava]|uniref:ImmA/IrrE family metallo-endopeptidase n=1 Tax=Alteromonas flava TaxID=2048003 RepID=UPI000C2820F7|nr:ImmA/IrrE family metallo-endopeptidase [Alteromonas flava]
MAYVKKGLIERKQGQVDASLRDPEHLIQLAEEKGICTSPLNIAALVAELGIAVRYEPMPEDDSGSLMLDKATGKWVMTINSLHHPHRQRFTMAHELGHHARHAPLSDEFRDKNFFRNAESNAMEREANAFAAELLMPKDKFENFIANTSDEIEQIAKHFQVSSLAVRVRAKELGYSGHNL